MNLLHLRYFLEVAKKESITEASKTLFISQPALSKSISVLEESIGITLFDREKQKIHLNENGKFFFENVLNAIDILDSSVFELRNKSELALDSINLLLLSPSTMFMSELISGYHKAVPTVKFHLTKLRTTVFDERKYDAIIFTEDNQECLRLIPLSRKLFTEDIELVVNKNHPLAKKESVVTKDLKNEKLALYTSRRFIYCLKQSNKTIKRFLETEENIVLNSNSPLAICKFVSDENAISFIPSITWHPYVFSNLTLLKVADLKFTRSIYIFSSVNGKKKKNLNDFLNYMIKELNI